MHPLAQAVPLTEVSTREPINEYSLEYSHVDAVAEGPSLKPRLSTVDSFSQAIPLPKVFSRERCSRGLMPTLLVEGSCFVTSPSCRVHPLLVQIPSWVAHHALSCALCLQGCMGSAGNCAMIATAWGLLCPTVPQHACTDKQCQGSCRYILMYKRAPLF
jgi:hypothetical protein